MPHKLPIHQPLPYIAKAHKPQGKAENYGRGRGGRPWRRLRAQVLQEAGYLCQCPLCKGSALPLLADEVDHIIPLSQGGTDALENLQVINHVHHRIKTRNDLRKR